MNSHNFLSFIILILSVVIARLYSPFLEDFMIAVILAISTAETHFYMLSKIKIRVIAVSISTFLLSLLFFMPILYLISQIATLLNRFNKNEIMEYLEKTKEFFIKLADDFIFIQNYIHGFIDSLNISELTKQFIEFSTYFGSISLSFIVDIILILIFYFFIMLYSKDLISFLKATFPLNKNETDTLFEEIEKTIGVVFYSILVTAIFEGLLFGLMASYFGYNAILFTILYALASLIPVIGGILMWLPLSIYELSTGNYLNALYIILYSLIVISIIADTFIKPIIISYLNKLLVKDKGKLNELIIFFAIVAGLSTFGFWGMIIGPALTALFFSVIKIFQTRNIGLKK